MDRALDDIISERPRGPRQPDRRRNDRPPPRVPRRDDYPRDGVRKARGDDRPPYRSYDSNKRDEGANIDTDWIHDRYEEEYSGRRRRDSPDHEDRRDAPRGEPRRERRYAEPGTKLRVENLHYELAKDDVEELFNRIGPIQTAELLYDRSDRSRGIAFVTYFDARDADEAVRQFDGANAHGQPIRVSVAASGPPRNGGSLFDRVEQPGRSLFDRVDHGARRGGRGRSSSPRKERRDDVDRYEPRRGDRSPRRGGPRERGRRPGARREESGRERRPRADDAGRPSGKGRPRKTAEELDAEMADYFGGAAEKDTNGAAETTAPATGNGDNDIDMIS